MIGWLATTALAGQDLTELELLAGARTAPGAALEQPSEWEPEPIEPMGVAALLARHRHFGAPGWYGLDATVWGVAPEADATLFALGPRAGLAWSTDTLRGEVAGRFDGQHYPFVTGTTNGRGELLLRGTWTHDAVEAGLQVEGVDREYVERTWSFRTIEPGATLTVGRGLRATAGVSVQGNQGSQLVGTDTALVEGTQLRLTAGLQGSTAHLAAWARYRLVDAWGGGAQAASRPVFTPVGDYSDDVDALSAGGFLQHRAELGASVDRDGWVISASALGRLRDARVPDLASYRRTGHGQVSVLRELGETWSARLTVGCSGAELASGAGYLDAYGWLGIGWSRERGTDRE